jgi:hypothetical protein
MHGRCTSAWVYVFVDPTNATVVARADSGFTAYQAIGLSLWVVGNDTAPAERTVSILSPPAHAQAMPDWDSVWFTADWDYVGQDFLIYAVCAGGTCAASSASIRIRGNAEPTPVDDNVETDEDNPISFNPMLNDTDPDGDALRFGGCWENEWPWRDATFLCNSESGWCDFSPAPTQTGPGSLQCMVCDELYCSMEYVYINVTRVVNPPECYADTASTQEDTSLDIRVLDNDAFNGGRARPETMTFTGPAHGTAVVDVDTGAVTYTPDANYPGPSDSFTYAVCDVFDLCCSAQVSLTITPVADPPAFTAAATNTLQRIARSGVPVALVATDPEGGTLTFSRVSGALPDHVTLNASGTFTSSGQHKKGTYRSVIRVSDPGGLAATTDLTIVVE